MTDDYFSEFGSNFNDAGIAVLKLNGSIVFVDKSGNIVNTASRIERCDENWLLHEGGFELVNDAAKTLLKFNERIDLLYPDEGDVARARIGEKWGLIGQQGEAILPFIFERIYAFQNNIAIVRFNGKWGVINSVGKWIVTPDYDSISMYEYCIKATLDSNSFYFNLAGEQITEPILKDEKQEYSEGLIKANLNSKWGYKDASGKWVIRPQYEEANDFYHGFASVSLNGIKKVIDKSGKSHSREGLAIAYSIREDSYGLFGFIDESEDWIIKPTFTNVGYFFEGFAKAKENRKWGFIDKCGKWVIEPKYEDVGNFHNGVVSVLWNDECHWINSKGEFVR